MHLGPVARFNSAVFSLKSILKGVVTLTNKSESLQMIDKTEKPLTIIHGPPGTGKSTVTAEIVLQIQRQKPDWKILVLAPSHAATDNILASMSKWDDDKSLFYRFGDHRKRFLYSLKSLILWLETQVYRFKPNLTVSKVQNDFVKRHHAVSVNDGETSKVEKLIDDMASQDYQDKES